ncbi:SAM-dependent methyltransferase [Enterovibrio norvegicus]|uniref:class I SAM-dependent DNA methyltransferase n=1 Tax=Enterovibrio norvegicus TaxID=188144 RepID=UPI000C8393A4|nr:class I SAM-dependent methyltransferase [Enterovibrio norvegicus]MCC4798870.1 class I SAM-dependent methyltransferase [Enterovibrio norvegicus]PMI32004.1 SAM-dependent methyltransferase [Enterovibrio norvegicus]PMI37489.1 SAM-dependent methyltransferase [Enterovibrio norvegicus]PMN50712.1 SAM-dependent methyltransferase [Enterovibrio norvegicus]TKF15132.1 class I SAM-dependent methyltransferase [Enterovibrio norvegicus]
MSFNTSSEASSNALYTDLSGYYDLMCVDINYEAQSQTIQRLHQLFGNKGNRHLDLACGTGPHVRYFLDYGYQSNGLDINQPMLDIAQTRCPEAQFSLQDMCTFAVDEPTDLITCFLYSMHYSGEIARLKALIESVYHALSPEGIFCFNAVDKDKINNDSFVRHSADNEGSHFVFQSCWHYGGEGEKQSLRLNIEKTTDNETQIWHDEHPMVAVSFSELQALLEPYFDVYMFEHDYDKIIPLDNTSGNALLVCVKKS